MPNFSAFDFITKALKRSLRAGNYDGLLETAKMSQKMSTEEPVTDLDTTYIIHHDAPKKSKKP